MPGDVGREADFPYLHLRRCCGAAWTSVDIQLAPQLVLINIKPYALANIGRDWGKLLDDKQMAAKLESSRKHYAKQTKKFAQNLVECSTINLLEYKDSDMLVFIDDTGDIVPSENCNFFCMGGVAVWGRDYRRIESEWNRLKWICLVFGQTSCFTQRRI